MIPDEAYAASRLVLLVLCVCGLAALLVLGFVLGTRDMEDQEDDK